MRKDVRLSVVIVNFNTKNLLRSCLESVYRCVREGKLAVEVLVVDNASIDGSAGMVKENFPKVLLIQNQENVGFAKANNQALREAKGNYFLLLNSDIKILPGFLDKILTFAKENLSAGVVGARLLFPNGEPQASVYHEPKIERAMAEYWFGKKGSYEKYLPLPEKATMVDAVVFAAVLIPRATVEKVGLLDERYFMYFEDLDYCRRVRKAGLSVYYFPEAEVIHHHGASGKGTKVTYQYLKESSQRYNGLIVFYLLTLIIRSSQIIRKLWVKFSQ